MLAIVALALTPLAGQAATVEFEVMSMANSSTGGTGLATGIVLEFGESFSVTAGVEDTWILGSETKRIGNADGLTFEPSGNPWNWTQDGFTTLFGTLVGMIGTGDFFAIGTAFSGDANAAGELRLFNWDSNSSDNRGFITAGVTYDSVSAIPLPATGLLLVGALGGLGLARRKRNAA